MRHPLSPAVALAIVSVCRVALGVTLSPGDIIITEFFDGWHKIDPVTHQVTELPFAEEDSSYLAVDPNGYIYFANETDEVSRLDWSTGAVSQVPVSNVQFIDGLVVEPGGTLLISEDDSIDRFNPATGQTVELTSATFFGPAGIAQGSDGRVFFTEFFSDLWELTGTSIGRRSVPTPDINAPDLITVQPSGDLIVLSIENELLRIDPDTGATGTFSTDVPASPVALAVEADGDVLLTAHDGVFRFDGATGVRSLVAEGSFFSPHGIVVIPGAATEPVPGDFDGDGAVDAGDYAMWRTQYGASGDSSADANGDGLVNAADYTVWRDAASGGPVSLSAPAPASAVLAACAVVLGWRRTRLPPTIKRG